MYHHVLCGLNNVFLKNGYHFETDPEYGECFSLSAMGDLQDEIGMSLIATPKQFNGYELRFLRASLGLTQREISNLLGCDVQAFGRWEKAKDAYIHGPVDRLMRAICLEYFYHQTVSLRNLLEELSKTTFYHQVRMECELNEKTNKWTVNVIPSSNVRMFAPTSSTFLAGSKL